MLEEVRYCNDIIKTEFNKPLKMTEDDEEKFIEADRCIFVNRNFIQCLIFVIYVM